MIALALAAKAVAVVYILALVVFGVGAAWINNWRRWR